MAESPVTSGSTACLQSHNKPQKAHQKIFIIAPLSNLLDTTDILHYHPHTRYCRRIILCVTGHWSSGMPVGDKSKRVKRLPEDLMTTHLSSGNPRQKRCQSSHGEHHTPTTQRKQLQTGIKVLTGMSVTNLALILAYLVNGKPSITYPQHNGP